MVSFLEEKCHEVEIIVKLLQSKFQKFAGASDPWNLDMIARIG
jgi:hypothetical protein